MKRNEKILVYAVTGFLAVVLGIAVLFGEDKLPRADREATAGTFDEILKDPSVLGSAQDPGDEEGEQGAGEKVEPPGSDPDTDPAAGSGEEAAPVSPTELNTVVITPAAQVRVLLGESQHVGNYRQVVVRSGDSPGLIAQRWCGSAQLIEELRLLNEGVDLTALRPGQMLFVPWVEDEKLLALHEERLANPKPAVAVRDGTAAPRPASTSGYKLKEGESLWTIAVGRVGKAKAPAYVEEVKALNPQIQDWWRVRAGTPIALPSR